MIRRQRPPVTLVGGKSKTLQRSRRTFRQVSAAIALIPVCMVALRLQQYSFRASRILRNSPPQHPEHKTTAEIRQDLLTVNPEDVWTKLIATAAAAAKGPFPGIVMEVGMHRAVQCLQAAHAGLHAYCVEPSPPSFGRVQRSVESEPKHVQDLVHLYQAAAGSTSGEELEFQSSGGTGDHVGDVDVWNMKAGPVEDEALKKKAGKTVRVPSIRLDDIVAESGKDHGDLEHVYLLKVDTQGFEPAVFAGLRDSVRQHKIDYILMEFWPKGMDLMAVDKELGDCIAGELLQSLVEFGYVLYAMGLMVHPNSPTAGKTFIKSSKAHDRPFHDVHEYCQWFYSLDQKFAGDEYKMGYWSDILVRV